MSFGDTSRGSTSGALDDNPAGPIFRLALALALGAWSMWAWRFSKMQYVVQLHGWTRFVSMQNQYSLTFTGDEVRSIGGVCTPRQPTGY